MSGKTLFLSFEGVYIMMSKNREINGIKALSYAAKVSKGQTTPEISKGYAFSQGSSNKGVENFPAIKVESPFSMHAFQMGTYAILDNNALISYSA